MCLRSGFGRAICQLGRRSRWLLDNFHADLQKVGARESPRGHESLGSCKRDFQVGRSIYSPPPKWEFGTSPQGPEMMPDSVFHKKLMLKCN